MAFDTIVANGRWFDGTGAPSLIRHLGITDGRVVAVSPTALDDTNAHVIDATGKWVVPGFLDVHTHYDVEVWNGPGLEESVRHGVTSVMVGSCSIGTIHVDAEDAGDLFGRVEAIPRNHVVKAMTEYKTWNSAEEYVTALERRPLGANVFAMIGHSDLRVATMGLERATDEHATPRPTELTLMERMLEEALDAAFVGLSTMNLKFDKLDGERCRSRTVPSTYAKAREFRRLKRILRRRGAIVQSAPNVKNPLDLLFHAVRSAGMFRKPLKTTLVAAADVKSNRFGVHAINALSRVADLLRAEFKFQHLPVPFTVYADGIDFVIFEEFGAGEEALHLADCVERDELMSDEAYRRRFRKDYDDRFGIKSWHRDFFDAHIVACPNDPALVGKTFGEVGLDRGGIHPVDAFLDLVVEHGRTLRWYTTISGHRPRVADRWARDPHVHMGFSDAGAHMRNMAFYNMGLRLLKRVHEAERAGAPFMTLEHAVHRLSGELATWFGVDAGHLRVGDRADFSIIDPAGLDGAVDEFAEEPAWQYDGMVRMVNRNDAAVSAVFVSGRQVIADGTPTEALGTIRTGSFLRAGRQAPAVVSRVPVA